MSLDLMVFILEKIFSKKIKNGAYIVNLDEYLDCGTHWIALYVKDIDFDSFGVEQFIGVD